MAELQDLRGEDWDWGWGYEPDMFLEPHEMEWCIRSSGHEHTWVPPEIRGKKQSEFGIISVIGGHGDECLADWESVLSFCNLDYQRLEGLVYK